MNAKSIWLAGALATISLLGVVPGEVGAHGPGTWNDIYGLIIGWTGCPPGDPNCVPPPPPPSVGGCVNCHFPGGGPQSGGLLPSRDEDSWYGALVNAKPVNGSATTAGKLRVHKHQPWNSYLVDKLMGHLKGGEGAPMPQNPSDPAASVPYAFTCPGGVAKIVGWIRDGADADGVTPSDPTPGSVNCDLSQPDFLAPEAPAPGEGRPLVGASGTVAHPARELPLVKTFELGNASDELVNRIEIAASAGTEYVSVTRVGEAAPLAVARGERLDLDLPDGVAVRLPASTTIEVRQLIRNDYWKPPASAGERYTNETDGIAVVNLHAISAEELVAEARPVGDDLGTQTLFVPPQRLGTAGGAFMDSGGATNALLGIWTDRRAFGAALVGVAGIRAAGELPGATADELTVGYVRMDGSPAVTYRCLHGNGTHDNLNGDVSNTLKSRETTAGTVGKLIGTPQRYACANTAAAGRPITPGLPPLLGEAGTSCARSNFPTTNDCDGIGLENCVPANLVGGSGVNDGRCTLVGLVW